MKHGIAGIVCGFIWMFLLGLPVLLADRLFGLKVEDTPASPLAKAIAWVFVIGFWVAVIAGGYTSYRSEARNKEHEARNRENEEKRRQAELAELRAQVKKSVLDELRKEPKGT
jgi:type VI protein secretion system component VasK